MAQMLNNVVYTLYVEGYENPIRIMHGEEPFDSILTFARWNGLNDADVEEIIEFVCNDVEAPKCNRRWERKKIFEFMVGVRGRGRGNVVEFYEDSDIERVGLEACKKIPGCIPPPDPRVDPGAVVASRVVTAFELELREELQTRLDEYKRGQVRDENFYVRLGLGERKTKAKVKEISTAFRELSLKWHPDRSGGDHEMFLLVQEAYDVLGDEKKRAMYDGVVGFAGGGAFMEGGEGLWDGVDGRPLVQGNKGIFRDVSVDDAGNVRILL